MLVQAMKVRKKILLVENTDPVNEAIDGLSRHWQHRHCLLTADYCCPYLLVSSSACWFKCMLVQVQAVCVHV